MRKMACLLGMVVLAAPVMATTVMYGWEDGGTVLGTFSTVLATNVTAPDPVHTGEHSLKLVDNYSGSATPQAYVAWITGLSAGDIVTASIWRYDTTPAGSPSCRIWGHWNDTADVMGYSGSASGNSDYGPSTGWDETSYSWTVVAPHTGLVVEVRTYSDALDTVWVDDLTVTAPDSATIYVPEPASLALLALALLRRR